MVFNCRVRDLLSLVLLHDDFFRATSDTLSIIKDLHLEVM